MSKGKTLNSEDIKNIARLSYSGLNKTAIGLRLGFSRFTVAHILNKLYASDIVSEEVLKEKKGQELIDICYSSKSQDGLNDDKHKEAYITRSNNYPNFDDIALDRLITRENKQYYYFEYLDACITNNHPTLSRSAFYSMLLRAEKRLKLKSDDPIMIIDKPYGFSCEIDFAGTKINVTMPGDKVVTLNVFLAVWSASCYTFGSFVQRQSTQATCSALSRAFILWDCTPHEIIPDNAKAWVDDCSEIGDPVINKSFEDYLNQFDVFINPALPRSPTHKSRVEYAVRLVTERILTRYDTKTPRTLQEHNLCLQEMIDKYINQATFHNDKVHTREYLFKHYEKPKAKKMLYAIPDFAIISYAKVRKNYHVEYKGKLYSVPFKYIYHTVTIKEYENTLNIYCDNKLIASHIKLLDSDKNISTSKEHMPENHRVIANKRKYHSIEQVLDEAQNQSVALYTYCKYKATTGKGASFKACVDILNFYMQCKNKAILNITISEVMGEPAHDRNNYVIKRTYANRIDKLRYEESLVIERANAITPEHTIAEGGVYRDVNGLILSNLNKKN